MGSESLAFKDWARNEGLHSFGSLRLLKESTVAIDAEDYLNTLLIQARTREPLLPALGGLPFALEQHIDSDLANFYDADIKPIFVFPGLDVACKDRRSISRESQKAIKILDDAWTVYDQGRGDDAVVAFGKACTYHTQHIMRYFQIYVHSKGIPILVAPYNAAAQIVDMKNEEVVHSVAGSASCLVYGANRTIIGFDWENRTFSWLTLQKVLDKFSVTQEQFVDMCLLSGSSILPTMPEIDNDGPIPRMAAAKSVMKRANMDGHTACLQANDAEYLSLFRKARFAVKHMVVVKSDGAIEPLDKDNAPSDTHDFIGQRLPDELSAYHARGLAGGRVLTWRTRQEIFETPPLDGGSSQAYRDLIQEKLLPLRARSLAIVTPSLHRYYHKHEVGLVCWFNEGEERKLGLTDMALTDVTKDAETWHVKDEMMSESADAHQLHESPLQYAVALLSDNKLAKKTVTRRPIGDHSLLQTPSELLANTVWRFLQDRGYLNSDHTLSAWGQALKIAFVQARKDHYLTETYPTGEAEESIFLAFELLRLDILNSRQMFPTPPYSGAPLRGTEADKAHTLLISRVACLGTFKHDTIGYTGPLSRHLLAYHQMVAAVRNSLRDIAEMHACNMLLSGSALRLRDLKQYGDLGARLPFAREPDLGLALVVKSYLDELSNDTNRRADIKRWFNHALDIDGDLQKAWKMWGAINAGIQAADSAIVSSETKTLFENADTWLQQKRQAAPITNGTNSANGANNTA